MKRTHWSSITDSNGATGDYKKVEQRERCSSLCPGGSGQPHHKWVSCGKGLKPHENKATMSQHISEKQHRTQWAGKQNRSRQIEPIKGKEEELPQSKAGRLKSWQQPVMSTGYLGSNYKKWRASLIRRAESLKSHFHLNNEMPVPASHRGSVCAVLIFCAHDGWGNVAAKWGHQGGCPNLPVQLLALDTTLPLAATPIQKRTKIPHKKPLVANVFISTLPPKMSPKRAHRNQCWSRVVLVLIAHLVT